MSGRSLACSSTVVQALRPERGLGHPHSVEQRRYEAEEAPNEFLPTRNDLRP